MEELLIYLALITITILLAFRMIDRVEEKQEEEETEDEMFNTFVLMDNDGDLYLFYEDKDGSQYVQNKNAHRKTTLSVKDIIRFVLPGAVYIGEL